MTRLLILLLLACCPMLSWGQLGSSVTPNAPITNFKLPVLNDQGQRTSLLRGSEATYINASQIDLTGMQYSTFLENGSNEVDTTLLAPVASVFIENNKIRVHGEQNVRLIGKNLEVTGEKWTYDHTQKQILIEKNVRVVFQIEFKGILK